MRHRRRHRASLRAMLGWLALVLVLGAPAAGVAELQTPEPDPAAAQPPGDPERQAEEKRRKPRRDEHPVDYFAGDCPRIVDGDRRSFLMFVFDHLEADAGRLPALPALPEPIKQRSQDYFVELHEEMGKCSTTFSAKLAATEATELRERAHDFLGEVEELLRRILNVFTKVESLRQASRRLASDLEALRGLPVRPAEWPPADICARCPRRLQYLTTLIARVEELAAAGTEVPRDQLGTALEFERTLRTRLSSACQLIRSLLAADLGEADRKARYYSWTETRRSFDTVISILKSKDIQYWCGRR